MMEASGSEQMDTNEVEEVFTIESGNDLIDVYVVAVSRGDEGSERAASVKKELLDTSFLIFSEGLASVRRIGLIKIGPDNYYALQKDKSMIYKLNSNVFVFPAQDSVDFTVEEQWLVLELKSEKEYVNTQFNEILAYFANVVVEVPGAIPELDAIKKLNLTGGQRLYPSLRTVPAPAPVPAATPAPAPVPAEPSAAPTEFRAPSPSSPAKSIAKGIVTGAEYVAMGFNAGTGFAAGLVHQGGEHLISQETRYQPKRIDPKVIQTLRTVRSGAETCSTVADAVVDRIAAGAQCLGQKLVPHVQRHGTRLVSNATGKDSETSGRYVSDLLSVTASGLQGFGTIYQSVTASAMQLSKAVAGETVKYVQRRYGDDAAEATNEALYAAGNVYQATTAVSQLAPKAVVKRAAREAAAEGVRTSFAQPEAVPQA